MTQDEIIEMAMKSCCPKVNAFANFDILQEFAKMVAAKEREACAKTLESISNASDIKAYAATIRARGEA